MIENLKGIHETVNYKDKTRLRLYVNDENEHYPAHWHTPLEILCPLRDGYDAVCSQKPYHLRTGDILFICPGTIHDLPAHAQGVRIIFQADCTPLYAVGEMETILSLMAPALLVTPEKFPSDYLALHRLMLEIRDEYTTGQPLGEGAIYARLIEMLVLVGRSRTWDAARFDAKSFKRREYCEKMLDICSYISEHCTENLTLEQAAARAGYSKYHFDRLFRQFTDIPYYKYLNQKRIACAERMLIDPSVTVTEVAMRSGFSSITAFTRMFKVVKHCTPSQFRKIHILQG